MIYATVITDASFDPRDNSAGWAAWIRVDGHDQPIKRYGAFKGRIDTSTDAEKKAALNGIAIAKGMGADFVLLQTDCMAVVNCMAGHMRKRKTISNWNCMIEASGLRGFKMTARHVKGHTKTKDARSYVNRWCDKMANKARKTT
jgi:ribonuclease HI